MHPSAERFSTAAKERYDFDVDVHEFDNGTKTATDAAAAIGCDVAQIASSLVFEVDRGIVVVVTSGANRVSEEKLGDAVGGDDVSMADPDDIKETVGWSIGGVPPFCHDSDVPVYMDETLFEYAEVWAAAGTPEAVFPIAPERIETIADATVADVAE